MICYKIFNPPPKKGHPKQKGGERERERSDRIKVKKVAASVVFSTFPVNASYLTSLLIRVGLLAIRLPKPLFVRTYAGFMLLLHVLY